MRDGGGGEGGGNEYGNRFEIHRQEERERAAYKRHIIKVMIYYWGDE